MDYLQQLKDFADHNHAAVWSETTNDKDPLEVAAIQIVRAIDELTNNDRPLSAAKYFIHACVTWDEQEVPNTHTVDSKVAGYASHIRHF